MPRATRSLATRALPAALAFAACTSEPPPPARIPLARITAEPALQIGVVEGDHNYELFRVTGAVWLSDGRVVVVNGGTAELRYYDREGRFLRRVGGRGKGPGEFTALTRVYRAAGDTVLGYDAWYLDRLSVFDERGDFVRNIAGRRLSEDPYFPVDAWLYHRFWVLGALDRTTREAARAILDRLPDVTEPEAYRVVRLAADGQPWLREPVPDSGTTQRWLVVGHDARPLHVVEIPSDVAVYEVGSGRVLGLWRDSNDVNYVRSWAVVDTPDSVPVPEWLAAPEPRDLQVFSPGDTARILDALRSALRDFVMAQEAYFAGHLAYAVERDSLQLELPREIALHLVEAAEWGYSAVATWRGFPRICGIALGDLLPAGWPEGAPRCGP